MDHLDLLIDLHKENPRQGPGGNAETRKSIALAGLEPSRPLTIADIGCGTGATTLVLAAELNACVTAVDFLPEFLEILSNRAADQGLGERIETLACPMEQLAFGEQSFDVIWSEGAIYNMGFENGVRQWRRFLKPGGTLVVSEITWTTAQRPVELTAHWQEEYPEIDTAAAKIAILERYGYTPVAYHLLPQHCWQENYYRPLQQGFDRFLTRNDNSQPAQAVVEAEKKEIALYERYKGYYSYGVYIARRTA